MHSPDTSDPTIDPKVKRDLGDWGWAAIDARLHTTRRMDLTVEHSILAKSKDRYSGTVFSTAEYQAMSQNTDEQLQQTRVGMLYRIGGLTSRGGVINKWMAELDYTYPWIGRNATEAARTSLELINYF
jgi:hypothetical protein